MEYQEFLDALLKIVTTAAFSVAIYVVAYLANKFKNWVATKLGIENVELLNKYADMFVQAAEQLFTKKNSGEEKKAYVLEQLAYLGFESSEDVSAAIESAVFKMNQDKNKI